MLGREELLPRIYEKVNDRWDVCVTLSDGQFQQVSFVNSIATIKGGTHVAYISEQVVNQIMGVVNKKNKSVGVRAFQVRNHLWIFVNALTENPAFDSQTKESLTTLLKCGIVESVLTFAEFKQTKDLKKTDGSKRQRIMAIPKLDDANDGGRNSQECTLILTEGDSAKALAMAGISVVGRNKYGCFPLRGKLLNIREASHQQVMDYAEITNIKKTFGLQQGKDYEDIGSLRYGHLMITTDQDHDGSHIKGLLINFIHSFRPSILKIPSFLLEFITPIVKATHKSGQALAFYSMPEYESWKISIEGCAKDWNIKYYKGLGTSTSKPQEYVGTQTLKSLALGTLTFEEVEQLLRQQDKLEGAVAELRNLCPKDLWTRDLQSFLLQLDAETCRSRRMKNSRRVTWSTKGLRF